MTPRLIHPETLVREFPQPAVFQVPDPLLAPAPAAVQDVEPVGMAGAVGDKGLNPAAIDIRDAKLRPGRGVFHPEVLLQSWGSRKTGVE